LTGNMSIPVAFHPHQRCGTEGYSDTIWRTRSRLERWCGQSFST